MPETYIHDKLYKASSGGPTHDRKFNITLQALWNKNITLDVQWNFAFPPNTPDRIVKLGNNITRDHGSLFNETVAFRGLQPAAMLQISMQTRIEAMKSYKSLIHPELANKNLRRQENVVLFSNDCWYRAYRASTVITSISQEVTLFNTNKDILFVMDPVGCDPNLPCTVWIDGSERRKFRYVCEPRIAQVMNCELISDLQYLALSCYACDELIQATVYDWSRDQWVRNLGVVAPKKPGPTLFDFLRLKVIVVIRFYPQVPVDITKKDMRRARKSNKTWLPSAIEYLNTVISPGFTPPRIIIVMDMAELEIMLKKGKFPGI